MIFHSSACTAVHFAFPEEDSVIKKETHDKLANLAQRRLAFSIAGEKETLKKTSVNKGEIAEDALLDIGKVTTQTKSGRDRVSK